jgi:hypothetical protein
LAGLLVPFRREQTVGRGIAMTREVLRATSDLARARGARPLIVVPQFGVEDPAERALRLRILDDAGLPYVWIEIADGWRLSRSLHPNAAAARAIATAIVSDLQRLSVP